MEQPPFIERSRYYLAYEYPAKIRLALETLDDEAMWRRPNSDSNSIANLLLHLAGNIRQWIVTGIGGIPGERDRFGEFAAASGFTKPELLAGLNAAVADADDVLARIGEDEFDRVVTIQGRETTVFAAIYHVVEHFSMHTGQVLMLAKIHNPGAIRFYEDAGGIAIPLWGGAERMKSG